MTTLKAMLFLLTVNSVALAQNPWDLAKKAAGKEASATVEKEINSRLLAEGRKNQCSFKSDSDQLMPGCDQKLKNLASALIDAKKKLNSAGVSNFKFEVSGHTDSSGNAAHNKELSGRRAAVIAKELAARGVAENEIASIGMGADKPVVSPDNTPEKKAKNRRYEIQVRL
jgi:outer membrane protein OmpA-like peptidoglycan-associated protein